jgi:hypothetical protein
MATPTRPVQDGIIDPLWGQWVHDHIVRMSASVGSFTFGDMGAIGAGAWRSLSVFTMTNKPAGIYMLQADCQLATVSNGYLGFRTAAQAVGTNARVALENNTPSITITVPFTVLITHPAAGDLAIWTDYGFGGGTVHLKGGFVLVTLLQDNAASATALALQQAADLARSGLGDTSDTQPVEAEPK